MATQRIELTPEEDFVVSVTSNKGAVGSLFDQTTESFWETAGGDMAPHLTLRLLPGRGPALRRRLLLAAGGAAVEAKAQAQAPAVLGYELQLHVDNQRDSELKLKARHAGNPRLGLWRAPSERQRLNHGSRYRCGKSTFS